MKERRWKKWEEKKNAIKEVEMEEVDRRVGVKGEAGSQNKTR